MSCHSGKSYSGIVPSKMTVKYLYPYMTMANERESYSSLEMLGIINEIESTGGHIVEFSFNTRILLHGEAYCEWESFSQLIKRMYELLLIDKNSYRAIVTFVPAMYRRVLFRDSISN